MDRYIKDYIERRGGVEELSEEEKSALASLVEAAREITKGREISAYPPKGRTWYRVSNEGRDIATVEAKSVMDALKFVAKDSFHDDVDHVQVWSEINKNNLVVSRNEGDFTKSKGKWKRSGGKPRKRS